MCTNNYSNKERFDNVITLLSYYLRDMYYLSLSFFLSHFSCVFMLFHVLPISVNKDVCITKIKWCIFASQCRYIQTSFSKFPSHKKSI